MRLVLQCTENSPEQRCAKCCTHAARVHSDMFTQSKTSHPALQRHTAAKHTDARCAQVHSIQSLLLLCNPTHSYL